MKEGLVGQERWNKIVDIHNNKDPLRGLALALHYSAMEGFHGFSETLEPVFKEDSDHASQLLANLYLEYLLLFMHMTSRHAFELFGMDGRDAIANALLPYLAKNAGAYFEGNQKQLENLVMRNSNETEAIYGKTEYWISPTETNSFKAFQDEKATEVQFFKRLAYALDQDITNPITQLEIMNSSLWGIGLFNKMVDLKVWLQGPAHKLGLI